MGEQSRNDAGNSTGGAFEWIIERVGVGWLVVGSRTGN
jgi:hypothetical protein